MKKKDKISKKNINYLNRYSKWVPPKILIILIMSVFVLFINLYSFKLDNDFWFLINTGKYILNNGMPTIEPFTIHANLEFIAQQWLTDVIFYLIYNKFGIYGMYTLVSLISILIAVLIYKIALLVSDNKIKGSTLITIIIFILLSRGFITTRPQMFDILLLSLELYLLELWIRRNKGIYLIGLPIISILMINLHSSLWLMIFVFLLPYYVEIIKKLSQDKKKLISMILINVIMILVGLINPYGIDSIKYLFNSYGVDVINNIISEMRSIDITNHLVMYSYIFVVLLSFYYNKGKNKIRYLLLTLGTCYLALSHYKGIMFFLVCSVLSLSHNFKDLFNEAMKQEKFYKSKKLNIFVVAILIIFFSIYIYDLYTINLTENNQPYLYNLVNYLDKNTTKNMKIYTGYNDGGYLEYRGYRCYLDPRAEVFLKSNNKKEDILIEYTRLKSGKLNYKEFLDKYNFDYLIVDEYDILYTYIDEGYEIVYEEKVESPFEAEQINYRIYKRVR